MNWFMALNVVCCEPVADFARRLGQAAGVSEPNTIGMPPVALKKLVSALATFCWLPLSPPSAPGAKLSVQIEIGVGGVVAQAGREIRRQVGVDERAEGAADAAGGQDGVLLRDVAAVGVRSH